MGAEYAYSGVVAGLFSISGLVCQRLVWGQTCVCEAGVCFFAELCILKCGQPALTRESTLWNFYALREKYERGGGEKSAVNVFCQCA